MLTRLSAALARWNARRRALAAARAALDELFARRAELLAAGRLKPHHRGRATILEYDVAPDGGVRRVLFGIVRHPKAHALAPRGDEVLELLEYRPPEGTLAVVGSRNLTRDPYTPAPPTGDA
ncbi:MAG: hypothetical protein MUF27_06940 [Acidobacteria bacterium]|nr:hypothetical protein [Acidobacteriota bacterium]